jgi:hypothetical protein
MAPMCLAMAWTLASLGRGQAAPAASNQARYIWSKDLVCIGTIASIDSLTRAMALTCGGLDSTSGFNVVDYRIGQLEVLQGTAEDSTITVTCLRDMVFDLGECRIGSHMLFWGNRLCEDRWRLWGRFALVRPSGRVLAGMEDWELFHDSTTGDRDPTLQQVLAQAPAGRPGGIGGLLTRARAIGIARVTKIHPADAKLMAVELDSLGWAWGSGERLQTTLLYKKSTDCWLNFMSGDTLLVPTAGVGEPAIVVLYRCPGELRTKFGFVPSLGVRLASLRRAIDNANDGMVQVPILRRE